MTRDIYWVVALAFGFILLLILCREKNRIKDDFGGVTRAFFFLGIASFIYCLLDMLWGLCYGIFRTIWSDSCGADCVGYI